MVYKGLWCIEAGRVSYSHVDFEAITKSNMLMKFVCNLKRLMESDKKAYDIKCIILALKLYRGGI